LALMELEDVASEESVPPLIASLNDSDPVVRRLAIGLLEELGDARAVPAIIERMLDSDPTVRDAASAALRDFRGDLAALHMLGAIGHDNPEVRRAVIVGLRELKDPRSVTPLLGALSDPVPGVRREAVITLAYLRLPESVSPLRALLADPDESVRRVTVGALGYFVDIYGGLAAQLETVASLIELGVPTRVYSVSLGGFDTHSDERATQQRLLTELDGALSGFYRRLQGSDRGRQVVTAVYSEFGRRVRANSGDGTDHGTAGPVFLLGANAGGRLIGAQPSLTDLEDGDIKFHTDFRQVYAAILDKWLGVSSKEVLGAEFKAVEIFKG